MRFKNLKQGFLKPGIGEGENGITASQTSGRYKRRQGKFSLTTIDIMGGTHLFASREKKSGKGRYR